MNTLDFAILNHQCVTLATVLAENSGTLKREIEILGKLTGWIAKETDLYSKRYKLKADGRMKGVGKSYIALGRGIKG